MLRDVGYILVAVLTTTLGRPVGPAELRLLEENGWTAWPPRLPEQPIFYPVLNRDYATRIARDWNVKHDGAGYVTEFDVETSFLDAYEVHQVGGQTCVQRCRRMRSPSGGLGRDLSSWPLTPGQHESRCARRTEGVPGDGRPHSGHAGDHRLPAARHQGSTRPGDCGTGRRPHAGGQDAPRPQAASVSAPGAARRGSPRTNPVGSALPRGPAASHRANPSGSRRSSSSSN